MCSLQCVRRQIRERLGRQVDLAQGGVNILGKGAVHKSLIFDEKVTKLQPIGIESSGYQKSLKEQKSQDESKR